MHKLVFATNNKHKIEEISHLLNGRLEIAGLKDIGCFSEIPETADSLEGNALLKALYVRETYGFNCFADDTGLEISALNGRPGVFSARYAGAQHDFEANIDKVLEELVGITDRSARFRTVIALILDDRHYFFEGIVEGTLLKTRRGNAGFGYDPIFVPNGYQSTFAEMPLAEKNRISHRGKAVKKLIEFLMNSGI